MPATTLHWRKQCEDDGLQYPEERSGNLFSLAVCVSMLGTVSVQPFMKRWSGV